MASYLVVKNGMESKKYLCNTTNTGSPFLRVDSGYLDLTTNTTTGLNVKINSSTTSTSEKTYETTSTRKSTYSSELTYFALYSATSTSSETGYDISSRSKTSGFTDFSYESTPLLYRYTWYSNSMSTYSSASTSGADYPGYSTRSFTKWYSTSSGPYSHSYVTNTSFTYNVSIHASNTRYANRYSTSNSNLLSLGSVLAYSSATYRYAGRMTNFTYGTGYWSASYSNGFYYQLGNVMYASYWSTPVTTTGYKQTSTLKSYSYISATGSDMTISSQSNSNWISSYMYYSYYTTSSEYSFTTSSEQSLTTKLCFFIDQ